MIKMGIDQSFRKTGICVVDSEENVLFHDVISTECGDKSILTKVDNAVEIARQLVVLVDIYNVDLVNIEGLSFGARGDATRDLAGLLFIILSYLKKVVDVEIIPPNTLKKHATGNGRASKEDMLSSLPDDMIEAFMKVSIAKGRYDLADAYWLACY